jgi:hypothetical protein
MQARLLPLEDPASYGAAAKMPRNISELDVVEVSWPKAKRLLKLSVGRTGDRGGPREQQYTAITVAVDAGEAELAGVTRTPLPGTLNRVCIWPAGGGDEDLVILFSLAAADALDSGVYAFRVSAGGAVADIPTGGALSAFGGFEVIDLDDDESYELVTARNLDGMPGGFSYHAVRRYSGAEYVADPERFKESYYVDEMAFLSWVIETRAAIQANPEPYMGKGLYGFYYAAEYQKQLYGFDSLVELPDTAGGEVDLPSYNKLRSEAFRRVVSYRDELQRWLGGGERPATWKLTR